MKDPNRLDALRQGRNDIEQALIDDLAQGELDRATFLRRGTVIGMSVPLLGGLLAAAGEAPLAFAKPAAAKAGGRIRVGIIPPPTGAIEPHTLLDQGGLETVGIAGEFLTRTNHALQLVPELATKWTANKNATVWTFKLRPGVKFQNGTPFSADDVVATYNRLITAADSTAASAYKGVLGAGSVQKVDDLTVAFHLLAPNGNFPYLTSSTTYQAVILPSNYQVGSYTTSPQTTGAFKLTSYTPGVGAKYDRFAGWWGGQAPLDGVDVTYFSDDAAVTSALLGGTIDLIGQIQVATSRALLANSAVQVFTARGSTHREVPMRVDVKPFSDKRVRRAIALTLDRPAIVKQLFAGKADIGNDSPFAPVYPSTSKLPQRHKDLRTAKQLLAAAGYPHGFSITLTTEKTGEIPQLAQIIANSVKPLGIKMSLKILTSTAYFAGKQIGPPSGWGTTPWLNTPINITDWGSRAVPNVLLTSALVSHGVWNAAHFSNKQYDSLVKQYVAAHTLADQRRASRKIEALLLDQTPVIFPYFYYYLAAGSKKVSGYQADALGQVYLSHTSLA